MKVSRFLPLLTWALATQIALSADVEPAIKVKIYDPTETYGTKVDDQGRLRISPTTQHTIKTVVVSKQIAAGAQSTTEYTVPASNRAEFTLAYGGGTGAGTFSFQKHTAATTAFVTNGDFENGTQVTAWAAVTGSFTAPSPDSSSVQFQTGAASMRWIYLNSATQLERKQTFGTAQDFSGYRYIRARFYNDTVAATTRILRVILTAGAATRTYELSGTTGTAPFSNNTWVTLTGEIEAPTSFVGTFDPTAVTAISVFMDDAANRTGTVYWDSVELVDALDTLHKFYAGGTNISGTTVVPIMPARQLVAGDAVYVTIKNTSNQANEYTAVLRGVEYVP